MHGWIIVLIGLIAIVALIIKSLVKNIRSGKGTCSCGCADCAAKCGKKGSCH